MPKYDNACINCGLCAQYCPSELQPQEIWRFSQCGEQPPAELKLADCVFCGVCDYLCPSDLPLTASFSEAFAHLQLQRKREQRAQRALQRFQQREQRLASERERLRNRRLQAQQQPGNERQAARSVDARQLQILKCEQQLQRLDPGSTAYAKLQERLAALRNGQ